MRINEALEFATWSPEELTEALTDKRIILVKCINFAIFSLLLFLFFFSIYLVGTSLSEQSLVSELSKVQSFGLLTFVVLVSIGILFLSSFLTVRLAARLRIMPRRLARLTIKNWKSNGSHLGMIAGISAGNGFSGC